MLTLVVGIFFCGCGFERSVPRGVEVDGVQVGGMSISKAVALLKSQKENSLKSKRLDIYADERVFSYYYQDFLLTENYAQIVKNSKRMEKYSAETKLSLKESAINELINKVEYPAKDAYAVFNKDGEPFTYKNGVSGRICLVERLKRDIQNSLNGDFSPVHLQTEEVKPLCTIDEIKENTKLLYSFTTYFDGTNLTRSANIKLAAEKLNGSIILPLETLSFNDIVGDRTVENGFQTAKIIEGGKFVDGVGGGVCQVSTTLYNTALLSGLKITEYHPHSLAVSYVAPSRDAMVSGKKFDLKITNEGYTPIYIRMNAFQSGITCSIYGKSDGYDYSIKSNIVGCIPQPPTVVIEGNEDKIVSFGREGTLSEGYLIKKRGRDEKITLLRKDRYLPLSTVKERAPCVKSDSVEDNIDKTQEYICGLTQN